MNGLTIIRVDPKKLRRAREERGLKGPWVAQQAGISKQTLSAYERGVASPTADTAERICQLYGIPLSELMTERDMASAVESLKRLGRMYGVEVRAA